MVDVLSKDELEAVALKPSYTPGRAYQFVCTYGWVTVGFFVDQPDAFTIRLAHASYYQSAGGQSHADLARRGGNESTQWRYEGTKLITKMHVISSVEYSGLVYRGI